MNKHFLKSELKEVKMTSFKNYDIFNIILKHGQILKGDITLTSIDRKRNKLYIIYKRMSECSYN